MSNNNRYSYLISEEKRLLSVLANVRNQIIEIKNGYKKHFLEEEKILYTLGIIKKGSLGDIKEFMVNFDNSYKSPKTIQSIEQTCEILLR